jgi:hypothetical protein
VRGFVGNPIWSAPFCKQVPSSTRPWHRWLHTVGTAHGKALAAEAHARARMICLEQRSPDGPLHVNVVRLLSRTIGAVCRRCCTTHLARFMLHDSCCTIHVARLILHDSCCTTHVARFMLHDSCCTTHVARLMLHVAGRMMHVACVACTLHDA